MLHQLNRRLVENQFFLCEGKENGAAAFTLFRTSLLDLFGIDIYERNGCFRTVKLWIASCDQNDLAISSDEFDGFLGRQRSQDTGYSFVADCLQRIIE